MSSGEAKRTLIARALVHEPRTLLFDEPGNTLDIAGQLELRQAMRELARAGLGVLLVTHHVSEIIPEIERVVLLQKGKIVADGPKEKVLTSAQLSSLFEVPVRLFHEDGYFFPPRLKTHPVGPPPRRAPFSAPRASRILLRNSIRNVRRHRHAERLMLVCLHQQQNPQYQSRQPDQPVEHAHHAPSEQSAKCPAHEKHTDDQNV